MTTVSLSADPILAFTTAGGAPLVGGTLLTQVAGTNYPTYSDAAGTIQMPNPIVLNSRGEVATAAGTSTPLYVVPSVAYTYTLSDANGTTIWSAPNITSAATLTTILANLTAANLGAITNVQTTAENMAGVVPSNYAYPQGDIRRYGGVDDNATDNIGPINQAILVGGTIRFPVSNTGIYRTSGAHVLADGVSFVGMGNRTGSPYYGSGLKYTGAGTMLTTIGRNTLSDLELSTTLSAAPAGGATVALSWGGVSVNAGQVRTLRCRIINFHIGLQNGGGLWCTLQDCAITNNDYGLGFNMTGSTTSNACLYLNNEIAFNGRGGIIGISVPVRMIGQTFLAGSVEGNCQENTVTYPDQINTGACAQLTFEGVYFEFATAAVIKPNMINFNTTSSWSVQQCYFNQYGQAVYSTSTNNGKVANCRFLTTASAWSGVTAYVLGNCVTSGGVTYQCILGHTNQVPPNATYWSPVYDWNFAGGGNVHDITVEGIRTQTGSLTSILTGANAWYQYGEDTFTATLTGAGGQTGTVLFTIVNKQCTLAIPIITGTSVSTGCTLTGMPSGCIPARLQSLTGVTTNSGADSISRITVDTGGVINLYNGASLVFTNTGVKGIQATTFTYPLT